jgi:hypothetical protein
MHLRLDKFVEIRYIIVLRSPAATFSPQEEETWRMETYYIVIDEELDEVVAMNWHVELYGRKSDARSRVKEVLDRISKKCGGMELRNDGEPA